MRHLLAVFSALFLSATLSAEIVEIKHMDELNRYLDGNTLIVFDIDNTLIEPVQTLGSDQWFEHRVKELVEQGSTLDDALTETRYEWNSIQGVTQVSAVEEQTAPLVKRLQQEGYAVMGLTTRSMGISLLTKHQLRQVGIDLRTTAPTHGEVYMHNGRGTIFTDGVLFTSATNKGMAFEKFIRALNLAPKRVIFVNDKRSHLEELEFCCNKHKIPYIGLRYGYLDEKVAQFSGELAQQQRQHFGRILSDEAARKALSEVKG